MSYLTLPKRVFNSPLIEYANFYDGTFVNLIRLTKPYADGTSYAVYETTTNPFCSNGLFKTYDKAKEKFELMIQNQESSGLLIKERGTVDHTKPYPNTTTTYDTELYHTLPLPIEKIIGCMRDGKLSKTAIVKGNQTLTVYDTGGGDYNLFLLDGVKVGDRQECTLDQAIEVIKNFLS